MTEVILLEKIARLGNIGDIVDVANGFARNFLIPKKKALIATQNNKDVFAKRKAELEEANKIKLQEAQERLAKIDGLNIIIERQAGDDGRLYGSVTAKDIAIAINQSVQGNITSEQVILNSKVKEVGVYDFIVLLHPDVSADMTLEVKHHSAN